MLTEQETQKISVFATNIELAAAACLNDICVNACYDWGSSASANILRGKRDGSGELEMRAIRLAVRYKCFNFLASPIVYNYLHREWVGGSGLREHAWYKELLLP